MKKILVVDDEPAIVKLLEYNLKQEHYQVTTCGNGTDAVKLIMSESFDFIILDLMLPGTDGFDVTKQIRRAEISTPILMLTAKDSETDKILGLELGADDYVTKPFSPREIIARIKAIERRIESSDKQKDVLQVGDLRIDVRAHHVTVGSDRIELTPREFELLTFFASHVGQIMDRDMLLDHVWGYDYVGQTRMVDMQVSKLRDKVEPDPKRPRYIKTVRGYGYKMEDIFDA
ncbi:response regulator transcription factor [Lacticaseibacillus songhuajiangensis]|jgi:two-component system alkaline phosphatase synthesis response regulator PhoP|uniref:response regulator transcription factor n=1 Tax=Lacticaseibacillus songhuajiangensis TaxID=1296539 RepID=UPI000F77B533|nr:response regulator transcription factor [Lacticaseibacillus songhuajiangensis]MCI1283953.1 response regulator transcription factor [Lacticaseibacillus songhuajiangensis]